MHSRHMQKRRSRLQCWQPAHLLFQSRHSQSLRSGRCSPQPLTASGGSAPCPQGQSLIGKGALMKIADDQCQTDIGSDVLHGRDRGGPHSLVPWWSITKSILAAAVLKLAEAEKLNLGQLYADWPAPSTHPGSDQLWGERYQVRRPRYRTLWCWSRHRLGSLCVPGLAWAPNCRCIRLWHGRRDLQARSCAPCTQSVTALGQQ